MKKPDDVSQEGFDKIQDICRSMAPEYVLECFMTCWEEGSVYEQIAAYWMCGAINRIEEELPGHPRKKEFDSDETIGEKSVRRMKDMLADSNADRLRIMANKIDYVITEVVVNKVIAKIK